MLGADGMDAALDDARWVIRMLTGLGVRAICVTGRHAVLQPARAAAGAVPARRRLRSAGGSAARRCAPDRRDGAAQGGFPRASRSSGPPTATFRSGCRNVGQHAVRRGLTDFVGPRAHRALVSGAAGRRAAGHAAAPQVHLPDVQRLHDRAAHGPGIRAAIRWIRTTPLRPKPHASSPCAPAKGAGAPRIQAPCASPTRRSSSARPAATS